MQWYVKQFEKVSKYCIGIPKQNINEYVEAMARNGECSQMCNFIVAEVDSVPNMDQFIVLHEI